MSDTNIQLYECNVCTYSMPICQFTTYITKKYGVKPLKTCKKCSRPQDVKTRVLRKDAFLALPSATQLAIMNKVMDRRNKTKDIAILYGLKYIDLNYWISLGQLAPPPIEDVVRPLSRYDSLIDDLSDRRISIQTICDVYGVTYKTLRKEIDAGAYQPILVS
jgi:hypothetical protein